LRRSDTFEPLLTWGDSPDPDDEIQQATCDAVSHFFFLRLNDMYLQHVMNAALSLPTTTDFIAFDRSYVEAQMHGDLLLTRDLASIYARDA
jgi:hypothetical protein